jgi:hypothetical protein
MVYTELPGDTRSVVAWGIMLQDGR